MPAGQSNDDDTIYSFLSFRFSDVFRGGGGGGGQKGTLGRKGLNN